MSTANTEKSEYHGYSFLLETLERPVISPEQAAQSIQQQWGLEVLAVKELGSYEDRNFLATCGGCKL